MRDRQKARTRHAIVSAAGQLLGSGARPGLDQIAAAAGVSRATAYRYFPGLDALLSEAAVDLRVPPAEKLFAAASRDDAPARLRLVDEAFDAACREQEPALRLMLARMLERSLDRAPGDPPLRQNRRGPLLERALEPVRARLGEACFARLVEALTMIVGTEAFIALNDVAGLDREAAREARQWAIAALLDAALSEAAA